MNKLRGLSSEIGSVAYQEDENDDGVPEVDEVDSIDNKYYKSVKIPQESESLKSPDTLGKKKVSLRKFINPKKPPQTTKG